ncbi:peptidase C39 family protein [Nocardioides dilutus]
MSRLLPALVLALTLAVAPVTSSAHAPAAAKGPVRLIFDSSWDLGQDWRTGNKQGVRVRKGSLVLTKTALSRRYRGTTYDVGQWTSAWTSPGFGVTELIGSWQAVTPRNSWVEVRVRGRVGEQTSSWDILGRWAASDRRVRRTSVAGQGDDLADVAVDTWKVKDPGGAASYQVQVRLMRRSGASSRSPAVDALHAVATRLPAGLPSVSAPGPAAGITLEVPRYSQMAHVGHSPKYGGGGEAWCSPTSTSMVLGYYDRLPDASAYAWVGADHTDPWVDQAARATYDAAYEGTGNWVFNTAFAASLAGDAFVTRLPDLRAAEKYIAAGIPLVASLSFGSGELTGAPISSSAGHLLVIVGFTATGDVVVNDPASRSRSGVRRTYDRAELEAAWLGGSGGVVYVIRDEAHALP